MSGAIIVAICIGGAILLLATLGLIIIGIIRAAKTGGISKKEREAHADETKMIQDIFNGLSRMEERVEALETILIERQKKSL
ncbi:MAG: phage shock protein B [Desulfobacterales bacterium]|nr:phage shock protein B [Desulfobacterales bacterium]